MTDWGLNGGVYFGRQVEPPLTAAEQDQTIARGVRIDHFPIDDEPLRGEWRATGEDMTYQEDRHLFTVGPNGSGKTRLLLLPNLVRLRDWSILVVDPKGWLAAQTGAWRAGGRDHTVRVIDPFGVLERSFPHVVRAVPALTSRGFNPLAMLSPGGDRFNDDAANMARAIIKTDSHGEKHWAQSAQALVKGLIMGLRVQYQTHADLSLLRLILGWPGEMIADECRRMAQEYGRDFPAISAALNRFSNLSTDNKELMSIVSTAQTQTDWLDSVKITDSLKGDAFEFGFMKESPTTVYLILPPEELETQSVWLRLMIAAALRPLLRSVVPARVPVLFMLDEFAQLGHMEVIEKNLGLMREYGVKLWPILQDLGQMKDLYERRWESFIANAGMLHAFAPQDATTREYLSKLSGERLYWTTVQNRSRGSSTGEKSVSDSVNVSESSQSHRGPVYWPQHLASMGYGKAVVYSEGRAERVSCPDPKDIDWVREALEMAEVHM